MQIKSPKEAGGRPIADCCFTRINCGKEVQPGNQLSEPLNFEMYEWLPIYKSGTPLRIRKSQE